MLLVGTHQSVLVYYQHTERITHIKHCRSAGVMGQAYGIHAKFLQLLHLIHPQFVRYSHANAGMVKMNICSFYFHWFPINEKSSVYIKLKGSQSHFCNDLIHDLTVTFQCCAKRIQIGRIWAPQMRGSQSHFEISLGYKFSVSVIQPIFNPIGRLRSNSKFSIGILIGNRMYVVFPVMLLQPHISVYPCTLIIPSFFC